MELFGTALGYLERPQGNWNSRRLLERPPALDRPQGYFVLFIGSRYYLRPIILWNAPWPMDRPPGLWNRAFGSTWNARRAIGTAAGFWNGPWPSGTPEGLLDRPPGLWHRASGSTWNARRPLEQSLRLYLERAWRSGITRIRRLRYRCYRCCRSQSRKARGHQLLPIKSPSHAVECTTILGDEISHLYLFNVAIRIEVSQLR